MPLFEDIKLTYMIDIQPSEIKMKQTGPLNHESIFLNPIEGKKKYVYTCKP